MLFEEGGNGDRERIARAGGEQQGVQVKSKKGRKNSRTSKNLKEFSEKNSLEQVNIGENRREHPHEDLHCLHGRGKCRVSPVSKSRREAIASRYRLHGKSKAGKTRKRRNQRWRGGCGKPPERVLKEERHNAFH